MERIEEGKPNRRVFISAEWRDLLMLNYEVDPALLMGFVPPGTELDSFAGRTYMSLVGFRFLRSKLFGVLPLPFHSDFDEVNLRFYVRRRVGETDRRGVVFVREIVPKWAVAQVARVVYGENYVCYPMRHSIEIDRASPSVEYQWQIHQQWCRLHGKGGGTPTQPEVGSLEQFITEHYWGYSKRRHRCLEYEVAHKPWNVWRTTSSSFEGDGASAYGPELGRVLRDQPASAFIADGSPVSVLFGKNIHE